MSRAELLSLLNLLVAQDSITPAQRDEVIALFDAGNLTPDQLPLPLAEALQEPDNALAIALALAVLFLGATYGGRLLAGQPGIPLARRTDARDAVRAAFERHMLTIAPIAVGGSIRTWHKGMIDAVRTHIMEQTILGAAAPLAGKLLREVRSSIREQMGFLQRFAGRAAVAAATGATLTVGYVASRATLYGGAAWAGFFRGNESTSGDGLVCIYRARDDISTCDRCHAAAAGSPYLPGVGPMPGDVCRGRGRCRCTREMVFDPAAWSELTGRRLAA